MKTSITLLACVGLLSCGIFGAVRAQETDKAEGLLKRAHEISMHGRTLSADIVETSMKEERTLMTSGTLRALKPYEGEWHGKNSPEGPDTPSFIGKLEISALGSSGKERWIADGRQVIEVLEVRNEYLKGNESDFISHAGFPVACFFSPATYDLLKPQRYIGKEKVDGVSYEVVEATQLDATGHANLYTLYIGASGLVEGYRTHFTDPQDQKEITFSAWMKNVKVDTPMKAEEFVWAVPAGFTPFDPAMFDRALLPVEAKPVDFRLPRLGGGEFKLAEARRGEKAVLVNFWFVGCGPCRGEFPHLQKLYERLKSRGLEVIAINRGDTEPQVQRYIREGKFTFPVALGGPKDDAGSIYSLFGVKAFPTNYLLDADGKVIWRAMGYNEFTSPEFEAALKRAGIP
ncbi:MAG TPA: TlpA disulfide reductase family protein [Chthonomonadaceae bacterium]|nr:TlpA disulfide reductase family protein [Chthonomonadaceae bacterium]